MTWKDIVKNSDYEKEEDELNKVIEFMEGPALDTLSDIYNGMHERYSSGQYHGKNVAISWSQHGNRVARAWHSHDSHNSNRMARAWQEHDIRTVTARLSRDNHIVISLQ